MTGVMDCAASTAQRSNPAEGSSFVIWRKLRDLKLVKSGCGISPARGMPSRSGGG